MPPCATIARGTIPPHPKQSPRIHSYGVTRKPRSDFNPTLVTCAAMLTCIFSSFTLNSRGRRICPDPRVRRSPQPALPSGANSRTAGAERGAVQEVTDNAVWRRPNSLTRRLCPSVAPTRRRHEFAIHVQTEERVWRPRWPGIHHLARPKSSRPPHADRRTPKAACGLNLGS